MSILTRIRVIESLCKMFNDYHNNLYTPDWVIELQVNSTNEELCARLNNWRVNYPEQWAKYGIYVM